MSDLKLRLSNILYLFNQNLVRLILSLFVGVFVARHLGTENYGRFNFILSFLFIYQPLITFGLDEILLSQCRSTPEPKKLLGTSFIIRAITFFIGLVLTFPVLYSMNIDLKTITLTIFYLSSAITIPFSVTEIYLNAHLKIKRQVQLKTIMFIIMAITKILFVYLNLDLTYFIIISFSEIVLQALISYILFMKTYPHLKLKSWQFDKYLFKNYITEGFPLMLSLLVFRGMSKVDQMFIANFATMRDLGIYGAAAKLLDSWLFLPHIISTIYLPKISEQKKSIYDYFGLLSLSSIALVFACFFLGDLIIKVFYGSQFSGSSSFLKLYSIQFYFTFMGIGRINSMIKDSKTKINLYLSSLILLFNLVGNYYFIKQMGSIGVIWSSILANILGFFILSLLSKDIRAMLGQYFASNIVISKKALKYIRR